MAAAMLVEIVQVQPIILGLPQRLAIGLLALEFEHEYRAIRQNDRIDAFPQTQ